MSSVSDLYKSVILRHNQNPVNYEKLETPDHAIEAYNQFCGDHFHVYLKMNGEQIESISFHGYGCAISKASTSVLVEQLSGKTLEVAKTLIQLYLKTIQNPDPSEDSPEEFLAFAAAKKHPGREKCATLSWESMEEWMEVK